MESAITEERSRPKREAKRSFALGVFNGVAFNFAERLIDPPLVLTWFVGQLTDSNLLIGLVSPLGQAGWYLPQIFVSPRIQRMERKMPLYTLAAVIRVFAWLLLVAAVWMLDDPILLLSGFFVAYTVARVTSGLAGISFFDVVAKTIPAWRRGSLFAWRQFLGGLLGLGAGWIIKFVLNRPELPFPRGHAVLFALYCAAMAPALLAFIAIHEPDGETLPDSMTLGEQLHRARRLLRKDVIYRRYMAARLSLGLAEIALPFYGIYAKKVLGAPDGMVGVYVGVRVGAQLLFNLPWGMISDQRGNRLVMRLLGLGSGLAALLAVGLVALVQIFQFRGNWLPYLALPLFFLNGAVWPARVLSGSNFLLELAPNAERSLYLGLSNSLMGIIVLISGLGGLVVDLFGFVGLFVVALVLYLSGYIWATRLPEPREECRSED